MPPRQPTTILRAIVHASERVLLPRRHSRRSGSSFDILSWPNRALWRAAAGDGLYRTSEPSDHDAFWLHPSRLCSLQ